MTVAVSGACFVFFIGSNLSSTEHGVQMDALGWRQSFESGGRIDFAGPKSGVAAGIPIDGLGRAGGPLKGIPLYELWRHFAETRPELWVDPQALAKTAGATEPVLTDFQRWEVPWAPVRNAAGGLELVDSVTPETVDPLVEHGTTQIPPDSLPVTVTWPEPFATLFPGAAALEAYLEWRRMRTVLRLIADGDIAAALAQIDTALARREYEIVLPSELLFWGVAAEHDGEESLLAEADARFDIHASSWSRLQQDPDFLKRTSVPVTVPYLIGTLGLIWWQAKRELQAGKQPRRCDACRTVLPSTASKRRRYCTQEENAACYRARHRETVRRSRERL